MRVALALALAFALFAVTESAPLVAQVDTFEFADQEQQRRFRKLSDEFRCPMCQNTSLSGSTGGVAEDLRREVYRMILEGQSDAEIEQFMFERYGDFIFYKPRLTRDTLLLWFGPLLFLAVGALVAVAIWRRASSVDSAPTATGELDKESQQRLARLLEEARDSDSDQAQGRS